MVTEVVRRGRPRLTLRKRRDILVFLALALPNLVLIGLFTYRPLLTNLYYSTLDWTLGAKDATVIGFQNYIAFFTSPDSLNVLWVTLVFTAGTLVGTMILGLFVGVLLNLNLPGRGFTRSVVFSPFVLSGVAMGVVWSFIFDPTLGIMAIWLRQLGIASPYWFTDPNLALLMVIIVYVWKNLGFAAVVYLAGLQSVPKDQVEAAALDGASHARTFWHIKLPLLGPTSFFLLIIVALNSLQAFDLLAIMTPSGKGTNTLIFESYLQGFKEFNRAGYSAAISIVLFLLLFAFTLVNLSVSQKKVHYS